MIEAVVVIVEVVLVMLFFLDVLVIVVVVEVKVANQSMPLLQPGQIVSAPAAAAHH